MPVLKKMHVYMDTCSFHGSLKGAILSPCILSIYMYNKNKLFTFEKMISNEKAFRFMVHGEDNLFTLIISG